MLELMEERLESGQQTPEEWRTRARELRQEAVSEDVKGLREAALSLADRYKEGRSLCPDRAG